MHSWSQQLSFNTRKVSRKELQAFKTPPSDPTIVCQKLVCGEQVLFLPKHTSKQERKEMGKEKRKEGKMYINDHVIYDRKDEDVNPQEEVQYVLGKSIQELMKDADKCDFYVV